MNSLKNNSTAIMFGMRCFRSDLASIGGCIKSTPEDFKVTEIDLKRKLVRLDNIEETCSTDNSYEHRKSGKYQIPEATKESIHIEKVLKPESNHLETFSSSVDLTKHHKNLLDGLNETFFDRISEYANHCKEETVKDSQESSKNIKISPLCLGTFHEKSQRTVLYAATKYLFPHLKACVTENHDMKICQDEMYTTFRSLLSEVDANNLQCFVSRRKIHSVLDLSDMPCKSVRTKVHRLINQHYGSLLESKTFSSENPDGTSKIFIQLRVKERSKGQKRKQDGDQSQLCYTGFTLQKENLETLEAVQIVAKVLKVRPSDISYAGIKDKKAVTIQRMAASLPLQRVDGLLHNLQEKGIKVGNLHKRTGPITLGELWGNDFQITLRKVWLPGYEILSSNKCPTCKKCILEKHFVQKAEQVKKNGFINYFGKQRFGEEWSSPSGSLSADVGQAMLQSNYVKAVKLILSPDPKKTDAVNSAKKLFQETSDAKAALKLMPTFKIRECMLLKALHRHGVGQEGCRKALLGIPHHMRQLYIHSFTSLVWNHMASQRIVDHGFKVVPGDLVIPSGIKDMNKDDVILTSAGDVTEASKYTIRDVVLPLPGNTIKYPQNGVGQAYFDYLNSNGLGDCQFRLNALQINVPGDYRRLVEFPVNLEWRIFQEGRLEDIQSKQPGVCAKVGQEVCSSDFHITNLVDSVNQGNDSKHCEATAVKEVFMDDITDLEIKPSMKMTKGNNVCSCGNNYRSVEFSLELKFALASSTYATSMLREIMGKK